MEKESRKIPGLTDRAWLEVSLDAIDENYRRIRAYAQDARIMAVVKANAYGLGAVYLARHLEGLGVDSFAVACMEEAMELRRGGVTGDILTLGPILPHQLAQAAAENIATTIVSTDHARALSDAAAAQGVTLRGHIKLDAGLGRFGLVLEGRVEEAAAEALAIAALPGLRIEGVFTHYTAADLPVGDAFNRHQIALFDRTTQLLRAAGMSFLKHSASSYFTSVYPECHNDCVRVAALLLGLDAPPPHGVACVPSAQLRARIYQIKTLEMGRPVGYGPTVYTLRPTRIAVVPIGYADGLRRSIQNRASLIVNGQFAPIIGKISMDYLTLDVTDIPAEEGDIVTVFGRDGDAVQEMWQMADIYGATVGEVSSVLSPRIPRCYTRNGEIVQP